MDLTGIQALFGEAARLAERGEYLMAGEAYARALKDAKSPESHVPASALPQLLRSAYLNLAQVLNRTGDFKEALRFVEEGLALAPTNFGRAIAFSSKGEALCGLGRIREGISAFQEAALAHPIVGRLNSADAMTRLASGELLSLAEQWVDAAREVSGNAMNIQWQCECFTIRGKIAARRGDHPAAQAEFHRALELDSTYQDAQLQLQALPPA